MNEEEKKSKKPQSKCCKVCKIIGIVIGIIFLALAISVSIILIILATATKNVKRVDDNGYLYYAEYKHNYELSLFSFPLKIVRGGGCSAFISKNENGEVITGRNYDLPHKDNNKKITGLNVLLRLNKKGRYKSINLADAAWFSFIGVKYYRGTLDDGKTSKIFLAFLPYLCMDGINEKGLTVSILALDLKKNEKAVYQNVKKKKKIVITEMLRVILDNCATVNEAVDKAKNYNLVNILDGDYHLFITDETGNSVVIEWRFNQMIATYIDAVTNFYVSSDDAEDCYKDGKLKEKFIKPSNLTRPYRFGYGHGYERFKTITAFLDKHLTNNVTFQTLITNEDAINLLRNVSQEYVEGSPTSLTQYSAVYNNNLKEVKIYVFRDYSKYYTFKVQG